jgi:Ig-like domain from next to BRCA1 gene
MKSRLKITSVILLFAMLSSVVPALALPLQASAATCYQAQFVADVTVPDGTQYASNTTFTKTWRLRNIGTCAWSTSDVSMVFDSGAQLGAPNSVPLPSAVAVGSTVDISVNMTAPNAAGHYIGYWKFKTSQGTIFGIGINANKAWWVEINVPGNTTGSVVVDFTATADKATWTSGAGGLTFPGTEGDAKGFALKKDKPKFESGVEATQPGLLFVPQNITNGFIQAEYPVYKVDPGDKFQTTVGCEAGATTCYVAYRLDYKTGGVVKTFWTFRERFEGLTYTANLNLAPLAGKDVSFILYISAYGSPTGDRALWGNPVILRSGIVPPPPTVTGTPPTPTATKTPGPITPTVPPSACDKAQFLADVNIPDGTVLQPGAQFTKTWRLKNVGTCAWAKDTYQLVFFSGEKMNGPASAPFPKNVAVGETVDISVNLTAPSAAGSYRGYWMFKNASGALFGIGTQANKPWWVDIKVTGPTVTPGGPTATPSPTATPGGPTATPVAGKAYDFAAKACTDGKWFSGAGALPCPGTNGDAKGFVMTVSNPKLETGATDTRPGILTVPQNTQNGYIQGFFPAFKVQSGDRFRATINCESGATNCYVAFRLDYELGGAIKTIWGPFLERYEGQFYNVDADLSALAGQEVKFILTVLASGTAAGDRALWVGPYIYRAGVTQATPTSTTVAASPTVVATISATAAPTTYQNAKYNFKFALPTGATIQSQTDTLGRVNLPFASGTNLQEKYIDVNVRENVTPCGSTLVGGSAVTSENVTINNIQFNKQTSTEGAAGSVYDTVAYSTVRNNACISLSFVLHSANPGNFPTPPPLFDKNAESAVFTTIMNTFNWTNLGSGGNILLSDDFSSDKWSTGTDSDSSVEYVDNALKFVVFNPNFFASSGPNAIDYKNVHLEVTAKNNSLDPTTAFGIICNLQAVGGSGSFYFFAMTPGGDYVIVKTVTGQTDVVLTNNGQWASSNLIPKYASSYRVGADCSSSTLTLYVNGQQVASVSDSAYISGEVGLFTWSGEEAASGSANISFDDFVMTQL